MSLHINAQPGDIAETILLPGDPLRARHVAENLLDDAVCYNEVRGMLGYTGTYAFANVLLTMAGPLVIVLA